jgi:hypothetical protein
LQSAGNVHATVVLLQSVGVLCLNVLKNKNMATRCLEATRVFLCSRYDILFYRNLRYMRQMWRRKEKLAVLAILSALFNFEICAVLGYYVALNGNHLSTFRNNVSVPSSRVKKSKKTAWPLKMGPIGCPETSVKDYHSELHNIAEERRFNQHRGGSLKSRFTSHCS